ncbi:hypothetical protein LSTR_LSTR000493 [Laodelphax striatellus]|uniref:Uncharacterized protein n=1 Tax=Laodelphax striatellus TaxID=195883 RepID=A0A482X1T8_LAOST|nr:hypothetical protein LSTR_LSTR000493 [Laodelphax striatellus]
MDLTFAILAVLLIFHSCLSKTGEKFKSLTFKWYNTSDNPHHIPILPPDDCDSPHELKEKPISAVVHLYKIYTVYLETLAVFYQKEEWKLKCACGAFMTACSKSPVFSLVIDDPLSVDSDYALKLIDGGISGMTVYKPSLDSLYKCQWWSQDYHKEQSGSYRLVSAQFNKHGQLTYPVHEPGCLRSSGRCRLDKGMLIFNPMTIGSEGPLVADGSYAGLISWNGDLKSDSPVHVSIPENHWSFWFKKWPSPSSGICDVQLGKSIFQTAGGFYIRVTSYSGESLMAPWFVTQPYQARKRVAEDFFFKLPCIIFLRRRIML